MAYSQCAHLGDELEKISIFSKKGEKITAKDVMPKTTDKFSLLVFLRNFA